MVAVLANDRDDSEGDDIVPLDSLPFETYRRCDLEESAGQDVKTHCMIIALQRAAAIKFAEKLGLRLGSMQYLDPGYAHNILQEQI